MNFYRFAIFIKILHRPKVSCMQIFRISGNWFCTASLQAFSILPTKLLLKDFIYADYASKFISKSTLQRMSMTMNHLWGYVFFLGFEEKCMRDYYTTWQGCKALLHTHLPHWDKKKKKTICLFAKSNLTFAIFARLKSFFQKLQHVNFPRSLNYYPENWTNLAKSGHD